MRYALLALLIAAPLTAQQDSVTAEMTLVLPQGSVVVEDTTFVQSDLALTLNVNHVLSDEDRRRLIAEGIPHVQQDNGVPNWFLGGVLLVGAGWVLSKFFEDVETLTIYNNLHQTQEQAQEQGQEQGTTVTTTTRRGPPGWWNHRKKKKKHGGEDDGEELKL